MREIPLGNFVKSLLLGIVLSISDAPMALVLGNGWLGVLGLLALNVGVLYLVFELADRVELARKRQDKKTPWLLSSVIKSLFFGLIQGALSVILALVVVIVVAGGFDGAAFVPLLGICLKFALGQALKFFGFCVIAWGYGLVHTEGKKYL